MLAKVSVFRTPESEAQYFEAYDEILKQWPVQFEEVYIPTRFGDTHVIASGPKEAEALVLVHAAGSSATQWIRNVAELSKHFRTYAVDVIGEEGKSLLTRPIRSRREFADWVEDLFNGLQIESAYMVGNSYGGFLTLNAAFYLPERIKKVVLISPAATFEQMWPFYWHLFLPNAIHRFMPVWIGDKLGTLRLANSGYDWIWHGFPKDDRLARQAAIKRNSGYARNPVLPQVFSDKELRQISTPVLLLIGDSEVIYDPQQVIQRATRLVAGLKAEIVPNANHCAQLTAPEIINQKILNFCH